MCVLSSCRHRVQVKAAIVGRGGVVVGVRSLALLGFLGEPSAAMSAIHEDPKVSHRGVVEVNRVGVVYVRLSLDPGIVIHPWCGWMYCWDVGGYTFL